MKIKIGDRLVGDGEPTFIIAEIGSNHNGSLEKAKELIDVAVDSGADAVKFQSLKYDELYFPEKDSNMEKLFQQIELSEEMHKSLSFYCAKKNILFSSAPTYPRAVDMLQELDVKFFKIASPQTATYPQLITKISRLGKPIIMSTGYCTLKEIDRSIKVVWKTGNKKCILLHCISEYPTRPEMANLRFIQTLKNAYNVPVGFSDHTLGWEVAIASVAMGANVVEKHITMSRDEEGPDHFFALEPDELEKMIRDIRLVEESIGTGSKLEISEEESITLDKMRMKVISKKDIDKGELIDKDCDIHFKRNCEGIDAWEVYNSSDLVAKTNIKKSAPLTHSFIDLKSNNTTKIMVIGANWEQEPLVERAKNMGFYVIATNPYPLAEGFKHSDENYVVDPRNLLELDKIFRKSCPDSVIADECDYSMFAVAYLANKYNLPGPKMDSLIITNNKYLQRVIAEKGNIRQPNYKLCLTYVEALEAVDSLKLPVMVKPLDNRGSIGIFKVNKREDIKLAFFEAIANSHSRQVLIEEFIPGNVVTVEGIFADKFYNLSFSTKKMHPYYPSNAMHLQFPGNLSYNIVNNLYTINNNLIHNIGINFGFTHSEFIINNEDIYFIEVANRGGGVHISNKILPFLTEVDLSEILIRSSRGEKILMNNNFAPKNKYCLLHFFNFGTGKVKKIGNIEKVQSLDGVLDIRLNIKVGDYLGDIATAINRPGFVIVAAESKDVCESLVHQIESEISIEFDNRG